MKQATLTYYDSSHQYRVDGKRWSSITTVAKMPVDTFSLEQWQQRQIVVGMTVDPTLIQKAAVDLDNRDLIGKVAEEAKQAAKASAKADRGTQMHTAMEHMLLNPAKLVTDQQRADAERIAATLDAYGITIEPRWVEQIVMWPDEHVVGRFDAFARWRDDLFVLDLKSGRNAVAYPQSTAVQLSLYAGAPWVSADLTTKDDKTTVTEWEPLPGELRQDKGLVLLVEPDVDVGELWEIDLSYGAAGADLARQIRRWRMEKNYGRNASSLVAPEPRLPLTSAEAGAAGSVERSRVDPPVTAPDPASSNERRDALLERYRSLTDEQQRAFADRGIDRNDLDAIEAALDDIDPFARVTVPVTIVRPALADPLPVIDEGAEASVGDRDRLRAAFEVLEPDQRDWVVGHVAGAGNLSVTQLPSERRTLIGLALVRLASAGWHDDTLLEACLDASHCRTGLDGLHHADAVRLGAVVVDVCEDRYQFTVSDDGKVRLDRVA